MAATLGNKLRPIWIAGHDDALEFMDRAEDIELVA